MAPKAPVTKNDTRSASGAAVRLLITEIMNVQKRLADEEHPEARTLWHALGRFAGNRASARALE